jgi:hypothetical protein
MGTRIRPIMYPRVQNVFHTRLLIDKTRRILGFRVPVAILSHVPMPIQRRLQQASVWFNNSGYEVALGTWHMTMNTPSTTRGDT